MRRGSGPQQSAFGGPIQAGDGLDMATPASRSVTPVAPEKGVFPLDHFGECKQVGTFVLVLHVRPALTSVRAVGDTIGDGELHELLARVVVHCGALQALVQELPGVPHEQRADGGARPWETGLRAGGGTGAKWRHEVGREKHATGACSARGACQREARRLRRGHTTSQGR